MTLGPHDTCGLCGQPKVLIEVEYPEYPEGQRGPYAHFCVHCDQGCWAPQGMCGNCSIIRTREWQGRI